MDRKARALLMITKSTERLDKLHGTGGDAEAVRMAVAVRTSWKAEARAEGATEKEIEAAALAGIYS